jgi:DNA-binding response OmpR family regulator
MAKILSVASTEVLKTTRQLMLELEGHSVYSALTLAEVEKLAYVENVDLALIGHGFPGPKKRELAHAVNRLYPGLPILEMCFHSPEIPGANFVLSDSPDDVIKAIRHILEGRDVRGYAE